MVNVRIIEDRETMRTPSNGENRAPPYEFVVSPDPGAPKPALAFHAIELH